MFSQGFICPKGASFGALDSDPDRLRTPLVRRDGELREATLTGVFYPRAEPMTYTVDFADYGTEKDITAP